MKVTPSILFLTFASACSAVDPLDAQDFQTPGSGMQTGGSGAGAPDEGSGSYGQPGGGSDPGYYRGTGGMSTGGVLIVGSGGTTDDTGGGFGVGTGGSIASTGGAPNPSTGGASNPDTGGASAWKSNYTFTYYGKTDCAKFSAYDGFSIDSGTCSGKVSLTTDVRSYYAAPGDLSSIWQGAKCDTANPPNCDDQQNCGVCVELGCDPSGPYYLPSDPYKDPHGAFCRTDQSVVVKIVDACPASHPNNTYWCTASRPDHVDISCSAFRALTIDENSGGRVISQIGSINGKVRIVDCSVGLGVHDL